MSRLPSQRVAVACLVAAASAGAAVESLNVQVHRVVPHQTDAYTQGLVWWQGKLYESTGRRGTSELRRIDPTTGEVEQRAPISKLFFGEGLARDGERLVMLTWHAEQAFLFGIPDLEQRGTFRYRGEGWGLCHGGESFLMSDGSARLVFRDSDSFAVVGHVDVTLDGQPVRHLNELECVGEEIYANVYRQEVIVRIDTVSGRVTGVVDASGLLGPEEAASADVLNGIAHVPETGRFFITGKLWPKMFEVTFTPETD